MSGGASVSANSKMAQGPSWPGTPADGQQFFNTTLRRAAFYQASVSKWLSAEEYGIQWMPSGAMQPLTASNSQVGRGGMGRMIR